MLDFIKSLLKASFYASLIFFLAVFAVFIALAIASSTAGSGCVEADEMADNSVKVESNPVLDGVFGTYDDNDGGQIAEWHNTGLRTNNEEFIILVSGGWTPWYGSVMSQKKLTTLERCQTCAKRNGSDDENCLCYKNQQPKPEISPSGNPVKTDCDLAENQNNPNLCTCTLLNGKATDYGVFHFPLTYYDKTHNRKLPDEQMDVCKYDRGMGLYLGIFGRSGSDTPIRAYHLFSEDETCSILRNSKGQCIDEKGNDRTKYIFRSANSETFVKNDLNGNAIADPNPGDDIFHKQNEIIKLMIYDQFYSDNFGAYNVQFLKGVAKDGETGLLEYLVSIIEDEMLGEYNDHGIREGGVLKFMYNAIVQDLYFITALQALLSLYISFLGIVYLMGIVELNKKELMSRIVKIALVIFFTSPQSWEFYNQIIVGFFKDSMNFVIAFVTHLAESNLNPDESPLLIAASGSSAHAESAASRFSYIDNIIKNLFSDSVTRKIWGLFFTSLFGLVFIIAIYALIGYFIYVMLMAAAVYAITLMKLIFALSLGPIFIAFSLFKITSDMFKRWIAFIAARSLEMIMLFLILYLLITLVDKQFNAMFYYRACVENIGMGRMKFKILKSYVDRDFIDWITHILTLGGFIFLLQSIMEQIPKLAGSLISIGGSGNKGANSAFNMAKAMTGGAIGNAIGLGSAAASEILGKGFRGARIASRALGVSGAIDKVFDKIPFRGPRARLRDSVIDESLRRATVQASKSPNLKGAALDREIRRIVLNDITPVGLRDWRHKNKTKSALYDMTTENVLKRLDKKMVKDPLKKFIKDTARDLKKKNHGENALLGKDMNKAIKEKAREWADNNLAGGREAINDHLHNMKDSISRQGRLSASEAAKKFAGDNRLKDRYLQHLKDESLEKGKKGDALYSKKARNFIAKTYHRENDTRNPLKDKMLRTENFARDLTREASHSAIRNALVEGKTASDKEAVRNYYLGSGNDAGKLADAENANHRKALQQKMEDKLAKTEEQRSGYIASLKKSIRNQIGALDPSSQEFRDKKAQADAELLKMQEQHEAAVLGLAGKENYRDILKANGGWEAYRDGLVDFNGNTLLEAQARAQAFGGGKEGAGSSSQEISGVGQEPAPTQQSEFAQAQQYYGQQIQAESAGIKPSSEGLSFGGSLSDALSSDADKAGNLLPTASGQDASKVDSTLLYAFEMKKMQSDLKLRAAKWDLGTAEAELAKLGKDADPAREKELKHKITQAESDKEKMEREVSTIESQINDVKNAH